MNKAGLILKKHVNEADLQVSWEWEDRDKGIVKWTFKNLGSAVGSGLLFRATYPFGNAFWPIYEENPEFDTHFATLQTPLIDNGTENNSPPLAIFKNPDNSMFVAFVFTLSAGQEWSMLEAGFIDGLTPDYEGSPYIVPASKISMDNFVVTWDAGQCSGYNEQTGDNLPCPPNPLNVTSAVYSISDNVIPMFNDMIEPKNDETCLMKLIAGIETGNIDEIESGLDCAFGDLGKEIKDSLYLKEE